MRRQEKRRFVLLVVGIAISSFWNIGGIASIMPFMRALSAPSRIGDTAIASFAMDLTGIASVQGFLLLSGIVVLFLVITGNIFLALVTWRTIHFSRTVGYSLSTRMFETYIWQRYPFFLNRNSSELIKNLLGETNNVTGNIVKPTMDMIVEGLLSTAIIAFLVVINPVVALIAAGLLGGAYSAIFLFFRRSLSRAGRKRVKRNKERFSVSSDAFGAIKELKLRGLESHYAEQFGAIARSFEMAKARVQTISRLPKYALETVAFGGILSIALVIFANQSGTDMILPLISAYAFAGYRLMPSLQKLFSAVTTLRGNRASLRIVQRELSLHKDMIKEPSPRKFWFQVDFSLENILFAYPQSAHPALYGITMRVQKNTTVGIAGPTGCGKTTLVDVILRLLEPSDGFLFVDGTPLEKDDVRAWQQNFGYVPQTIYLSDTTVRRNIAFGVPEHEIDEERVAFAAKLANLHEFVLTMEEGYETEIGERGVRMSGGQRQRVGIARALYHDPDILVFDEATSALDSHTEDAVMEAIANLMHKKTIIMIAHRLTTLRQCDEIFVLDGGRIDAVGDYEDLCRSHPHFTKQLPE